MPFIVWGHASYTGETGSGAQRNGSYLATAAPAPAPATGTLQNVWLPLGLGRKPKAES